MTIGNGSEIKGQDAKITVTTPQGGTGTVTNANNFTLDGITFNLKGASSGETVNLNVTKMQTKPLIDLKNL